MNFDRSSVSLLLALGLAGSSALAAHAQSAQKWDKRGQDAEARADYDAAFEAYRQAHVLKPKDLRYQTRYERMRFQDSNTHLDRGRVLRQSGDLGGAITEFSRALQIDKGNQAAAQELLTSEMPSVNRDSSTGIAPKGVTGTAVASAVGVRGLHRRRVKRDIDSLSPPVGLKPVSDDPFTLHMAEDTKIIYQAIGKAAGLNVVFDDSYKSERIPVDLTNVSVFDALRIVGKISNSFWTPITSNTILVAQNSRANRTDLDDLAVETFYLTNVSQQNDANEVMVALRNLLDPSAKLYLVASENAIVVRATPDELTLAEKLINDLDRTRSEVVVDVAVLEVSRDLERDLGITLPTSFGLTPQYSNANESTSTTSTSTSSSTTTSGITLNTLGNLNATNFAVTLGGGTVNALLSDSDTRVLQNPRVRATDGQQATLKIGSKIPVATGTTTSTLTSTATATTQFTYLDVGVNIDMTPTVHQDGDVSLKMKIEISSETGTDTIDGVAEPVISQRVVQQVIQLKDGEPSLLAGLLQQQDTKNVSGTPGLGELPFLKYFFSSQDKVQQTDEIVFLIIPHIVRESPLTDENTRVIDTGTSQAIELRRGNPNENNQAENDDPTIGASTESRPHVQSTSAANAASAMISQMAAQAHPIAPQGSNSTGGIPEASLPPIDLTIVPAKTDQVAGSTFQVTVTASNARDLFSVPFQLQFDPKVLSLVNVDSGDLLSRDGQAPALVYRDEGGGIATISETRPPHSAGVSGQGTLCTLTFKALAPGNSSLTMVKVDATDSKQTNLPTVGTQVVVHVK